MKCKNCGAELNGKHVCEYCDTHYGYISDKGNGLFLIEYGNTVYRAYLVKVNTNKLVDVGRSVDGTLHRITKEVYRFEFETM